MGHVHVGRLPRTRRWQEVSALLADTPENVPAIAAATAFAAARQLEELAQNNTLQYSFWLLTRIATAARGQDFAGDLAQVGLHVQPETTTLQFIVQLADHVREQSARVGLSNHVDDLAALALRSTLLETIGAQGQGLFTSSIADVQAAFRPYGTDVQFGVVAHRFFGEFFSRTLRFVIARDLPNQIGGDKALGSLADAAEVSAAIDAYARQSAHIMQTFAIDWYSKNNWASHRAISPAQSKGFVNHALDKLRDELRLGAARA